MSNPDCIVVPRVTAWGCSRPYAAYLDHDHRIRIDLFLPYDAANYGNLVVWDGGHNEASIEYYRNRTRYPSTPEQKAAAKQAVARYQSFMDSIPKEFRQTLVVREKLPWNWRRVAWEPR